MGNSSKVKAFIDVSHLHKESEMSSSEPEMSSSHNRKKDRVGLWEPSNGALYPKNFSIILMCFYLAEGNSEGEEEGLGGLEGTLRALQLSGSFRSHIPFLLDS